MSSRPSAFHELAAKQAKCSTLRALFEQLVTRAEALAKLQGELEATIIKHREARTGQRFQFTKREKRTLENFEMDAAEVSNGQPDRIARLSDVSLLNVALLSEQQAIEFDEKLYATFRQEDQEFANKILAFRRETMKLVRRYIENSEFNGQVEAMHPIVHKGRSKRTR